MRNGINKVILLGRLGKEPEVFQFQNGEMVKASLATSSRYTDKDSGEKRESTQWHNLVFNAGLAGVARQHLFKGQLVYVEGRLRTRKWQDNQGLDRYTTEVTVTHLEIIEWRTTNQAASSATDRTETDNQISRAQVVPITGSVSATTEETVTMPDLDDWDDDTIPF